MSISILAKVKEFTEFWRDRLHELYEIEKSMPPLQGDELIPEIKREFCVANFFIDREEQDKDRFFTDVMKNVENIPLDLKASYLTLNAEIIQEWINHIRYLRELKFCVESDNATFKDFEYVLERAFDYFIDTYDGMSGALNCLKIDKSIREILKDEDTEQNAHLKSLEYRQKIINRYKQALDDISCYLNDDIANDPSLIRTDVGLIITEAYNDVNNIKI